MRLGDPGTLVFIGSGNYLLSIFQGLGPEKRKSCVRNRVYGPRREGLRVQVRVEVPHVVRWPLDRRLQCLFRGRARRLSRSTTQE